MKRALFAALCLCACGGSTLPDPSIGSISPSTMAGSDSTAISVQVHGVLPTAADYDDSSVQLDPTVSLLVGPLVVGTGKWEADGSLSGTVPSLLPTGTYDVRVSFSDGRSATLKNGFTVTPGRWPSNYSIDTVGNQKAGQPFTITVHANGANGSLFHGNVIVRTNKGTITPALSDAFQDGTLTQTLTIKDANTSVVLTVTDAQGHAGVSNAFDVTP